ncbi:ead/Ea22-like family protein [Escherichia coli]|nr:ead/Ea22-like family protein [Escherichia coli]
MKQMSLIEMDGFLKGKCIPSDLKVNETNAEYLVRKFAEAEAKISALSEDHQKAIESIKQADAAVKLAHEKFSALAAENAGLKSAHPQPFGPEMMKALDAYEKYQDEVPETGMLNAFFILRDSIRVDTPATDAFLAEVRAQGVEMLAKNHQSIVNALKGDSLFSDGECRHAAIVSAAVYFAAELRKGGNQ